MIFTKIFINTSLIIGFATQIALPMEKEVYDQVSQLLSTLPSASQALIIDALTQQNTKALSPVSTRSTKKIAPLSAEAIKLFEAVKNNEVKKVQDILKQTSTSKDCEKLLSSQNTLGETVLHIAAEFGYVDIITKIRVMMAYKDTFKRLCMIQDYEGKTLVHLATENNHTSVIESVRRLLLNQSSFADICKIKDNAGKNAHAFAVENGNFELAKTLSEILTK